MKKEDYDFNNAPIGTKLTFSDGTVVVKDGATSYESEDRVIDKINDSRVYDIVKIEEPAYKNIYTDSHYILEDEEREYLASVIKPFKNSVHSIAKEDAIRGQERISIYLKDGGSIRFPSFNKSSMYKNMETYKLYKLDELDLKKEE